jgi:hypothetical protein
LQKPLTVRELCVFSKKPSTHGNDFLLFGGFLFGCGFAEFLYAFERAFERATLALYVRNVIAGYMACIRWPEMDMSTSRDTPASFFGH